MKERKIAKTETGEDDDPHRDPGDHGRDALQDLTFSLNDP